MDLEQQHKFGTIKGVLIPNITMMFGVILFLRLGVITAHAGTTQMLFVIGLALVIMIFTSFSIGSLATNMHVGSGGIYYIISRTLGVEIGGAVGVALFIAQLISIALTVSGFSVSLCDLYPSLSVTMVEFITLTLLAILCGFSASWTLQIQGGILLLLCISILSILLGSSENLQIENNGYTPFYPGGSLNFWETFAMFYPALTGIEAGMALSGSLKNPGKSLFLGNILSLVFVAITYAIIAIFAYNSIPFNVLISDPFSFVDFAKWPMLVHLGIWGATLSSALGCLLGAPRMLQSMAEDNIVPKFFGKVYGARKEPRIALIISYALAAFLLFYTTIDQIIPMLAMICLFSYGLLNIVAASAEAMNTPSWRPELRTPKTASIIALFLIIIAMFMTAPGWAFFTMLTLTTIYLALRTRKLKVGFQDLRESLIFFISRLALYKLGRPTKHALTWHPQLLAFIQSPATQEKLVQLTHSLTRRSGVLTFASIIPEEWQSPERIYTTRQGLNKFFNKKKIACLLEIYPAPSIQEGYLQLIKAYGIGPIQPNTVVLEITKENINLDLVEIIDTCRLTKKNLILFRDYEQQPLSVFTSRKKSNTKKINIHWHPDQATNFDLTMSLVTTLTDGLIFGGANITIKAKPHDPAARDYLKSYLNSYCENSRIDANIAIIEAGSQHDDLGHLNFIGLEPLGTDPTDEGKEAYLKYLKDYFDKYDLGQATLFVTSYDNVDHRAIYFPNLES